MKTIENLGNFADYTNSILPMFSYPIAHRKINIFSSLNYQQSILFERWWCNNNYTTNPFGRRSAFQWFKVNFFVNLTLCSFCLLKTSLVKKHCLDLAAVVYLNYQSVAIITNSTVIFLKLVNSYYMSSHIIRIFNYMVIIMLYLKYI